MQQRDGAGTKKGEQYGNLHIIKRSFIASSCISSSISVIEMTNTPKEQTISYDARVQVLRKDVWLRKDDANSSHSQP